MNARSFAIAGLAIVGMATPAFSAASPSPETGMSIFVPSEVRWAQGPQALPAGAMWAVLEGDPSKPGPFTLRLKLPAGYRIPPHWHPSEERITVLEGTFQLGHGERFDPKVLRAMPPGSYAQIPKGHHHFATVKGEAIIQLHGTGPWEIRYVNPVDDPRGKPGAR